ncbi:hypothetical protein L798_13558 [Zootermopsis nevadensis]|uniref:Uncharacterized protein n=1 Tax=Zootermopsis nevadensis TaxID=136037 RepID=A0A067R0P2_ZOONE|nr:hypothetical protein L798_13558 [Zootermopsis nevadensis]
MIEVGKCEVLKFLLAGFKLYASDKNNSSVAPATFEKHTCLFTHFIQILPMARGQLLSQ